MARAASYGAQLHNLGRKCAPDPGALRQSMVVGEELTPTYGARITDVLKGMLRPALIPAPGNCFVMSDWNAIEARMNPWLSNESSAEPLLDIFRRNEDVYVTAAMKLHHCAADEVTPAQRQVEKVKILACGYAGGIGAFAAMGRAYGVALPESDARRAVDAWRRANPWAVQYWGKLEHAYMRSMRNKGHEFHAGRVAYLFDGEHLWYCLPSGRVLCYPYARLESDGVSYLKSAWKPAQGAEEWPRARLWKGLACENLCQAAANDLLRNALREIDNVVLHCHDEIVVECKIADAPAVANQITQVMTTPPAWAAGLPLAVEVKTLSRYSK